MMPRRVSSENLAAAENTSQIFIEKTYRWNIARHLLLKTGHDAVGALLFPLKSFVTCLQAAIFNYLGEASVPRRVDRRPIFIFESQLQMLQVVVERFAPVYQRVEYHAQAVDVRRLRQGLKGQDVRQGLERQLHACIK